LFSTFTLTERERGDACVQAGGGEELWFAPVPQNDVVSPFGCALCVTCARFQASP
jgi:hypothetical protein